MHGRVKTAGAPRKQKKSAVKPCSTLLWSSSCGYPGQISGTASADENFMMDFPELLLLFLVLNLRGALCAVVQWTELNEAKVCCCFFPFYSYFI